MNLERLARQVEEARKEGLAIKYNGVDEDLPEFILSNPTEEEFWNKQYIELKSKENEE